MAEFILPNLGDGVAQGDVLKVLVKVGDTIAVDQPVVELETDKATLEVPSDVAGTVKEIRVKAGDKVKPGQAVLVMENGAGAAAEPAKARAKPAKARRACEAPAEACQSSRSCEARTCEAGRTCRTCRTCAERLPNLPRPPSAPRAAVVDIAAGRQQPAAAGAGSRRAAASVHTSSPAAPSVRRLAREIGVDVSQVTGTGPGGRITQDDVKEFAKRVMHSIGGNGQAAAASPRPAGAGRARRCPISPSGARSSASR